MTRVWISFATALACVCIAGGNEPTGSAGIVEITLPRYQANLPDGPGREAFAAACLSCHTTRYITSQPRLTAAKWEESVRKMIKTYGAPISEEQVPQIVKYLMATKEAGKTASWESQTIQKRDDAPRISLATSSADRVHDEQRGGALYATHCAMCHGPTGAGDGASAGDKFPRPTDLSAARYQPQTLADAIHSGVPGTSMPGYPSLSNDDLRALVTFTRGLTAKEPDQPRAASDAIAQAKSLYAQNCVTCHGPDGAGDGLAATTLPRPPASFRQKQPTHQRALKIITEGVPGTTMPQWSAKLDDPQRRALAEYVRSFYIDQ